MTYTRVTALVLQLAGLPTIALVGLLLVEHLAKESIYPADLLLVYVLLSLGILGATLVCVGISDYHVYYTKLSLLFFLYGALAHLVVNHWLSTIAWSVPDAEPSQQLLWPSQLVGPGLTAVGMGENLLAASFWAMRRDMDAARLNAMNNTFCIFMLLAAVCSGSASVWLFVTGDDVLFRWLLWATTVFLILFVTMLFRIWGGKLSC